MEEYSSWGRGHSAKVLGRVIDAGVRISPPPPITYQKFSRITHKDKPRQLMRALHRQVRRPLNFKYGTEGYIQYQM